MINIKDKLNRTNILLHRDKIINADNISTEQFNDDIGQINGQINDLNDVVADSLKQDIFENETNLINSDLRLIEEKLVNKPAVTTKIDANGYNFKNSTFVIFPAGFDFSKRINTEYLFSRCFNLTGFTEPIYLDKCLDASDMFLYCESLTDVTLENTIPTPKADQGFDSDNGAWQNEEPTSELTDCSSMFYGCTNLTNVNLFDTSNVTRMDNMFYNCANLTTIPQFDTSNVTNVIYMFDGCLNLESLPLLDFDKVIYIGTFFDYSECKTLTDLGGFKNLKIDSIRALSEGKHLKLTLKDNKNIVNDNLFILAVITNGFLDCSFKIFFLYGK